MLRGLVIYTFAWVLIYAPLETFVTVQIAGGRGLLYGAYLMNVVGMVVMVCGALAGKQRRAFAPGLLTAGWSWTAATFWRATSDRFRFAEIHVPNPLLEGRGDAELWAACILTALACLGMAASLRLVLKADEAQFSR